jgi:ribosome-associated heat shock protein Hsp15
MSADGMSRKDADPASALRFDRWLWAARFFKTRALAAEAVSGGRVHLNGARTKPAKPIRIGDTVSVQRGEIATVIVVRGIAEQRRPAPEAALLYEETAESCRAREAFVARRRAEAAGRLERLGRPTKQARRESIRLRRGRD